MRILYDGRIYAGQAGGGINRYFTNLINRLPTTDRPLLTAIRHPSAQFPNHPNLRVSKYSRFRLTRFSAALEKAYFRTLESTLKFDLIHPTYYSLLTGKDVNEYKCPAVITVHDMTHERYPEFFSNAADTTVEAKRKAVMAAQAIICISHNTKCDLLDLYAIPENKITLIPLATDFSISQSYGHEAIPPQPYFLYVGGRAGYKNFDVLLKAFAKIVSTQSDVRLCITGSPFNANEQKTINDLGLSQFVCHYGFVSDHHIAKLYRCSVALVYPSLYEGFGLPPLEAMACGGAVIASNCSSIPEVVGDAGILVSPTSYKAFADALLWLLESPSMRENLVNKGFRQVKQFSWDKTAAQTYEVYSSVVD